MPTPPNAQTQIRVLTAALEHADKALLEAAGLLDEMGIRNNQQLAAWRTPINDALEFVGARPESEVVRRLIGERERNRDHEMALLTDAIRELFASGAAGGEHWDAAHAAEAKKQALAVLAMVEGKP